MKDYNYIRIICEENSRLSKTVIDEFLLYYAAGRNNLEQQMNKQFAHYKKVVREFKEEWTNMLKAQYLAHEIFKKEGLIKKLLNHSELQRLIKNERHYLEQLAKYSWRFSFSVITDNPTADFYIMEDIFSDEQFTLFSPGTTDLIREQSPILWFNLIGYNGACWQSYGPIGAYRGFEPDDIYFFATELRPGIEEEIQIMEDIERNPVPYMMLLSGANYPLVFHKRDQILHVRSEYTLEAVDTKMIRKNFKIEYNNDVYRLTLKNWGQYPHFTHAYYKETDKEIIITAATDRGFRKLVEGLNQYGSNFSDEPFIRVNHSMISTIKDILNRDVDLYEYENLFKKEPSEEVQKELNKINTFMTLVLPDINSGRKPDIENLAKKSGLDVNVARDLVRNMLDKLNDLDRQ